MKMKIEVDTGVCGGREDRQKRVRMPATMMLMPITMKAPRPARQNDVFPEPTITTKQREELVLCLDV